ncbi:Putative ribonuclease H protein At1g65750, partial [Linum grandiflorum]
LRWRVGNGESIGIWGDRWIATLAGHFIPSSLNELAIDAKVRELIDPTTNQWDSELVERCFPGAVAEAVLQIPFRDMEEADKLIWSSSRDGNFTIKAGYACWLKDFLSANSVAGRGLPEIWRNLWSICIPPKVKHFMWQFLHNKLPTGNKMSKRSKRHGDECPFCGLPETQIHRFGDCQWSSRIRPSDDCYDWFSQVKAIASTEELAQWCMLLWFLWKERNAHLFNGFRMREDEIASSAVHYLTNYKQAQDPSSEPVITNRLMRWERPPTSVVKINTDAGIHDTQGMGAGVVIRDDAGSFCLAAVVKYRGIWRPELAEAAAIEFGIKLALEHNFHKVIVESDSLVVIQGLQEVNDDVTELGNYYKSIRRLMSGFDHGSWRFCRREANMAAHIMAHSNAHWNHKLVCEGRPPIFLIDQLQLDNITGREFS